ncbi:MAG: DUF5134 domain-containing protein [Mycobacterium sp.]|nr:DUF5134 domain-containing protein [Mycobacterium sp.]
MIHELALRWVTTGLFLFSAAETALTIAVRPRPWARVAGHLLHFVMAVAMAAMAWPWGAQLPPTGPAVFFVLAAVWLATVAAVMAHTTAARLLDGYHALTMLATAWMYAIMSDHLLPLGSSIHNRAQPGAPMPGMEVAAMRMPVTSGSPMWFGALNWLGMAAFAIASVFWTRKYLRERQHDAALSRSLANLGQAAMAAGMTILFLATLFLI